MNPTNTTVAIEFKSVIDVEINFELVADMATKFELGVDNGMAETASINISYISSVTILLELVFEQKGLSLLCF